MNQTNLEVLLTQTRDRQPLVIMSHLPGNCAEMTPKQIRSLAAALIAAAEDCEKMPMGKRSFRSIKKYYPLAPDMRAAFGQ